MAYIGKSPVIGNFVKLDAITAVNGQAAYTMQNGGSNFTDYESVNQFLVSLNGTIQAPTDSFTVSGSTLTFASNLSTGDVIDFIMVFGNSLSAGTPTDATVTTAKLADSAVTAAKITDATITAAKLASGTVQNQSAFKNIIINGDMSIAQRSTSVASVTTSSYHTTDRWYIENNNMGTFTISQSTDVPTGQGFAKSLKFDCTTADASPASGDTIGLRQKFEGQNLQYLKYGTSSAESLTLSFWVKSNKTGTYTLELDQDGNSKDYSQTYTISSANTWEKKTLTYVGDTASALANDNSNELDIYFWLGAASDFTSGTLNTSWNSTVNANRVSPSQVNIADSTSNEWYVTGVQLEAGTSASDFEFLPADVNLNRCQRYLYRKISTDPYGPLCQGMQIGGSDCMMQGYHPVKMRSSPSLSISGSWAVESGTTNATFSLGTTRSNLFGWSNQQSISATDGSAAIIYGNNSSTATFTASAEL